MSVEVTNETDYEIAGKEFCDLADYVLNALHVSPEAELSIVFMEPEAIAVLHEKWLDLPGPTDVMSFPMDELRPGTSRQPSGPGMLGDIVICPEVAARQAQKAGHSSIEEMLLLCVHGILHLLGYDHAEEAEKKVMFALQRKLLLSFLAER